MSFPIILDFIVVTLLIATILYAVSLNKKLSALYQGRDELQRFMEGFSASLAKAEISMSKLRDSGEKTFIDLQTKLEESRTLRDDLSFLNERGEKLAATLEEAIRTGRTLEKHLESRAQTNPQPEKNSFDTSSTEDEPALIRSLRNVR